MKTKEEMLLIWKCSTQVMHIAHHTAASKYSNKHLRLAYFAAGFSAVVASSFFAALSELGNKYLYIAAGIISLIAAILTAVNSSINYSGKAKDHYQAAALFQGLRREIEEELVNCRLDNIKDSYEHIRVRWTKALESTLPLPQKIHNKVRIRIRKECTEDICICPPLESYSSNSQRKLKK